MALRWRFEKWRKYYVREEGTFAQLPLYVRALGGYLMKFADDDGRIQLGGKSPADAIAFRCGAEMGERRWLRKHIPQLLKDGYLVHEGDTLRIRNFTAAQSGIDRLPSESLAQRDSSAGEARAPLEEIAKAASEHEPGINPSRPDHNPCTRSDLQARNQGTSSRRSDLVRSRREEESLSPRAREGIEPSAAKPSAPETTAAEDPTVLARRRLVDRTWRQLNTLRRAIGAELSLAGVLDLPAMERGGLEALAMRIRDAGDQAEAQIGHVLAVLAAEARAKRTVQHLTGAAFEPRSWRFHLGRTIEDAARPPPSMRANPKTAGRALGAAAPSVDHPESTELRRIG